MPCALDNLPNAFKPGCTQDPGEGTLALLTSEETEAHRKNVSNPWPPSPGTASTEFKSSTVSPWKDLLPLYYMLNGLYQEVESTGQARTFRAKVSNEVSSSYTDRPQMSVLYRAHET